MSNENEQQFPPIDPQPVAQPVTDLPPAPAAAVPPPADTSYGPPPSFAPPPRPSRVFQLRSVVAVAVAGVVLGGLGGTAITHLAENPDHRDGWSDRPEPGTGQFPGDGQLPAPPNGQVPGVPQGDSGGLSSDDDGATSG